MEPVIKDKYLITFFLLLSMIGKIYPQDINNEVIELSLATVTKLALENSLDIQIAQYDSYISRTSLRDAESIFDTIFSAEASYNRDKKAQASTIAGSQSKEHSFSLGLEKKLPSGTTVSLAASASKKRADSTFSALNPYNQALAEVSITQELGKNFFGLADRAEIKVTKLDIENSQFTSLGDIEETLYRAQKSYWNLVLKENELLIREDMLKGAEKLYKIYENKYSLGLVEDSEFLAMEALVATRKSDLAVANLKRQAAKNDLLFLINRGDFQQKVVPKDRLTGSTAGIDLYAALKEATLSRRDYKGLKNELEKNGIYLVVKKNALWPQIDLEATLSRNNINSDRSNTWEGIGSDSNDEIALSLTVTVPLENRKAKAELEKVSLEKQQLLLRLKRIERLILQKINDKVNQVNTSDNQVRLYQAIVGLHQKKLDQQIKRIGYGRSNADTLIQYEEDLLKARLALTENLYQYRVGMIELDLTKNVLLDKYWDKPL